MSDSAALIEGAIAKHLVSQTLPMIGGVLCIIGVGLVDAFFIGQLGADALAAVSFLFPVTTALSSCGIGVLVGINSVISRTLGSGNREQAECRTAHGIAFSTLVGLAVAGLLYGTSRPLFDAMNASADLMPMIEAYVFPYCIGFPFLLVSMGANGALRGQGEAVKSSTVLIVAALVNAALDPLLIFGWGPIPKLGVAGAGYAVAVAYFVAMLIGFFLVNRSKLTFKPTKCLTGGVVRGISEIASVGVPAAVANAINPLGIAVLTGFLARHGDAAVAGFGAAGRLQAFSVVPLLALSSSIGPIVGQNWGADEYGRVRRALKLSGLFCVFYGLVVAVPLVVFRQQIGSVFTDDAAVVKALSHYLIIGAGGFFAYGLLIVSNGALNAIDKSGQALAVSVARVALVMVPLAWLGSPILGTSGIFGAELVANIVGGLAAFGLAWRSIQQR